MKKLKFAWKRFLFWIGAAALALFAIACAKPAEPASPAMQLDMAQMVEKAAGAEAVPADAEAAPTDADAVDLYETLGAPTHCTDELVSEKGWLSVHVDADVVLPNANLPIVRLAPMEVTMDGIRRYAEVLFDPAAKYVDLDNNELRAKGYWKLLADKMQVDIDHWEEYGRAKWDMKYETLEEARAVLAEFTENMKNAPESMPAITPVYEWRYSTSVHASGETTQRPYFHLYTTKDDAHFYALQVSDTEIDYFSSDRPAHSALGSRKKDVSGRVNISQEAAFAIAEETVQRLGVDGMTCTYQAGYVSDHQPYWYGYDFVYEREVNGVPVTFVNHGGDRNGREFIRITIDDAGITTLVYHFPKVVAEEITASATLLPFDEIKAVFDRMVMVVDNQTESAAWNRAGMPDLTVDYYVKEIRLGLAPVEESGDTGRYLLVPAWDFIGYDTGAVNGKEQGAHDSNEKDSFLTVNAVDGSVIGRNG